MAAARTAPLSDPARTCCSAARRQQPSNKTTLVINAITKNYSQIAGITGSDEVWFNSGD